jgi:hypothetical protein
VAERAATANEDVAGRIVKEIQSVAEWSGRGGKVSTQTYTTAVAQSARTIGTPSGYEKSIKSMTISPDPSASVNYLGHTSTPIEIALVMTGHATSDSVTITWSDEAGTNRTAIATTSQGRRWVATIPAGSAGIKLTLAQNERRDLVFNARTTAGLTATSSLAVWGPVANPPVINSFSVNPSAIRLFNNGSNRWMNRDDVDARCAVDRLDTSAGTKDSVKMRYIGETGGVVEVPMTRLSVAGTVATYQTFFPARTEYFGSGTSTWTCIVSRFSDGGPASRTTSVTVGRT